MGEGISALRAWAFAPQGGVLGAMILVICLFLLGSSLGAESGPAIFNIDVSPKKWKSVRMRDLPKDAVVAVQVESDGRLVVALVDSRGYGKPYRTSRPLFLGQVEKKLSFSVTIPEKGHYFLILDNRLGEEKRAATITVRAAKSPAPAPEKGTKSTSL
jgi:hypothetical protein